MRRGQGEVFAQYRTAGLRLYPSQLGVVSGLSAQHEAQRHEPGPPMTLGNMRELASAALDRRAQSRWQF